MGALCRVLIVLIFCCHTWSAVVRLAEVRHAAVC